MKMFKKIFKIDKKSEDSEVSIKEYYFNGIKMIFDQSDRNASSCFKIDLNFSKDLKSHEYVISSIKEESGRIEVENITESIIFDLTHQDILDLKDGNLDIELERIISKLNKDKNYGYDLYHLDNDSAKETVRKIVNIFIKNLEDKKKNFEIKLKEYE